MIALSDLVILTVSGTLLAAGIYRWQSNLPQDAVAPATTIVQERNQRPTSPDPALAGSRTPQSVESTGRTVSAPSTIGQGTGVPTGNAALSSATGLPETSVQDSANSGVSTASSSGNADTATQPSSSSSVDTASADTGLYGSYIVESGDSLSIIAEDHGTNVQTLQRINGIDGSLIFVGQELLYPLPAN